MLAAFKEQKYVEFLKLQLLIVVVKWLLCNTFPYRSWQFAARVGVPVVGRQFEGSG